MRHTSSRMTGCPFELTLARTVIGWRVEVQNSDHTKQLYSWLQIQVTLITLLIESSQRLNEIILVILLAGMGAGGGSTSLVHAAPRKVLHSPTYRFRKILKVVQVVRIVIEVKILRMTYPLTRRVCGLCANTGIKTSAGTNKINIANIRIISHISWHTKFFHLRLRLPSIYIISYNISSRIQEIKDFGLSLTSNTIKETIDLIPLTKRLWKTSLIYKHCYTLTLEERLEKPE